jgi:lysophospholipase L1-like esterase|mmetsp:Transcript_24348/g.44042  ORF Transcript_24348/g.44042 Transcript_24348/m.44042 type:complete len:264 (-) Transcript_24348:85-876(-)
MRPSILLLGDSITQQSSSAEYGGWSAHLMDVYQRRADVLNRGFAGYNTDWLVHLLQTSERSDLLGLGKNVQLVCVFFGANDASDAQLNPRHHVPLDRYSSNLAEIVSACRQELGADVKVVMICPPPVHHDSRLKYQIERYGDKATGDLERTLELSGQYAAAAKIVATDLDLPCLNIWHEMQQESKELDTYLSDGLHLSREGNLFVGSKLVDLIGTTWPEWAVTPCPHTKNFANASSQCSGLPQSGPWHDNIDYKNPASAFPRK